MRRAWAAAVAVVVLTVLPIVGQTWVVQRAGILMGDFRAFYCAARVVSHGQDPYHVEPLRRCEVASGQTLSYGNHHVAVPAPLPTYTLAALIPLGALPFPIAALIWGALLSAALAASARLLGRCTGLGWQIPLAALSLSLGVSSIPSGEIVPLALAAICAAAFFAWRRRWRLAALAAAASMMEPHIGLPVCVALALWAPATRWTLGISAAVLAACALAAGGFSTNVEYFARVLPSHAIAEAARDTQYSLTSVLASLGVPDVTAVQAGSLSYLVMLLCGVAVAGPLAKKSGNAAFLAVIPSAFALLGGTFVHLTQIAAALPAALLLVSNATGARRTLCATGLLLLCVPWGWAIAPSVGLAPAFPVAYLAWDLLGRNVRAAMISAFISGVLLLGLNTLYRDAASQPVRIYSGAAIDRDLAESTWSAYTRAQSTNSLATWLARVPTWAGLILVLGLAAGTVVRARVTSGVLDAKPEPV